MGPPGGGSRSDDEDGRSRGSPEGTATARVVRFRPRPDGRRREDPGRLIERWFHGEAHAGYPPESVVVAWLTVLDAGVAPPRAARALLARLGAATARAPTRDQRRLLDLLAHVATRGDDPLIDPEDTT